MAFMDGRDIDPDAIARIQFYYASRYNDNFQTKFVQATRCSDFYAEQISSGDKFFVNEFSDPSWICPDTSKIQIYNNPFLFDKGQNFVMVFNSCPVAVKADADSGTTPYTSAECASDDTISENIDVLRIGYKIMSQNFNP